MKKLAKVLSLALVLVMVLSLGGTAWAGTIIKTETVNTKLADSTTFTVTISKNGTDKAAHTYGAYQIFKGDLAEVFNVEYDDNDTPTDSSDDTPTGNRTSTGKTLSNLQWGDSIDSDKVAELITELNTILSTSLATNADAAAVAKAISDANIGNDSEKAQQMADAFNKALNTTASGTGTVAAGDASGSITGLKAGYYLIKDSADITGEGAQTRFILEVVANVTVYEKGSVPSVEKKVDDKNDAIGDTDPNNEDGVNWQDTADYDIGDTVPYKLTGTLPSTYDDYKWYYYKFTDTMDKGLAIQDVNNNVRVFVSTNTYKNDGSVNVTNWYDVTDEFIINYASDDPNYNILTVERPVAADTNHTVTDAGLKKITQGKLVNNNPKEDHTLEELKEEAASANKTDLSGTIDKNSEVVVLYNAILTNKAKYGTIGNHNTVKLTFSNNPNANGEGDKGETPPDENIVFVYRLIIDKTDPDQRKTEGEWGTLDSEAKKDYVKVTDDNGATFYYKRALYGADFDLYKILDAELASNLDLSEVNASWFTTNATKIKKFVDYDESDNEAYKSKSANGSILNSKFTFSGLDDGKYILVESTTPTGYNTAAPMLVTVTATHTQDSDTQNPITLTGLSGTVTDINGHEENISDDGTQTYVDVNSGSNHVASDEHTLHINVDNKQGVELPTTGGVGTTLFYVFGSMLVIAAAVYFVTKKRSEVE